MLHLRSLKKLRHADQAMPGRAWWTFHVISSVGLLAAGYLLGKKHH